MGRPTVPRTRKTLILRSDRNDRPKAKKQEKTIRNNVWLQRQGILRTLGE
jgi:hypothetical protein